MTSLQPVSRRPIFKLGVKKVGLSGNRILHGNSGIEIFGLVCLYNGFFAR
jgi:hypothetical protein